MIKLFAMEARSNVAVAINGRKRENFAEGDKVLVTRDEYLTLLRLGFKLVGEAEVSYDDIASLVVSPEPPVAVKEVEKPQKQKKTAKDESKTDSEGEKPTETAVDESKVEE